MPLTPTQCEDELRRLSKKLEERTDALAGLLDAAAEAEWDYKLTYAKKLRVAQGDNAPQREAVATIQAEDKLHTRLTTAAVADACREAVRSLRDQLSAVQSANANVRHQAGLT